MIEQVAENGDYTHKTIDSYGQLKIIVKDSESYRRIVRKLKKEDASYHTYQLKQQRAYRVVISPYTPQIFPQKWKRRLKNIDTRYEM